MKTRITINSDTTTIAKAKAIAKKNGVNLSFMVENHLRGLLKMPLLKNEK